MLREERAREDAARGAVYTPDTLSSWLAWRLAAWASISQGKPPPKPFSSNPMEGDAERVWIDPAAGSGRLLEAASRQLGGCVRLVGADIDAAALALAERRLAQTPHALIQGDALRALSPWFGRADAVILNPPYLGEKGRKGRFDTLLREDRARWEGRLRPRVDLQYLFMHLALDLLRAGGVFGALTAAYWPTATGADALRADLNQRAEILEIVDLGAWLPFERRGLHALMVWGRRTDTPSERARVWHLAGEHAIQDTIERQADADQGRPPDLLWMPPGGGAPWHWNSDEDTKLLSELDELGQPLAALLDDRQGVVSGADRAESGEGVFVLTTQEAEALQAQGVSESWLWPLLRGSDCAPFGVERDRRAARGGLFLLYMCGDEPEGPALEAVWRHLWRHRQRLCERREVRIGRRPWWALQWPRDFVRMKQPKLVCPRRATGALFTLDWAAHAVSSDCTWLSAVCAQNLEVLHLWMNSSVVDVQLQRRGKRKGKLVELYAQPLRALRIPSSPVGCPVSLEPMALDLALIDTLACSARTRGALVQHARARWGG